MPSPNLFVVCKPDHPVLKNLDAIRDRAQISVGSDAAAIARYAPDAEILLYSNLSGIAPFHEVWQAAKKVKWVQSLSAGVERIVASDLAHSDVPLTNARGVFKRSLAEFAILGALYHYKRVRRLIDSQRAHRWDDFHVGWLPDRVMGIVGYGEIGRECGLLAHALGMKIQAVRRRPEHSTADPILDRTFAPDALHEMLHAVDVLVAAAPLTPETRHMLSDREFSAMKNTAIVINVGRGPVIDQEALIRALQKKTIAGAALDVFEQEPLSQDSPLWDMENVLISPHCTDRTADPDWLDLAMRIFLENFEHYITGKALINVVDKKAGY